MIKYLQLLFFGICTTCSVQSQQLSHSVIATQGGISKAAGISLEWTLGETMTESLSTSNRLYTQGFHQPIVVVKKAVLPPGQQATSNSVKENLVSVLPNPVRTTLTVSFSNFIPSGCTFSLIDMSGKRQQTLPFALKGNSLQLDMNANPSGLYLLEIKSADGKLLHTFKVIKLR